MKGNLYLIPCLLGDASVSLSLPIENKHIIENCSEFIVENIREARRFIKKSGASNNLDTLVFHTLNKRTQPQDINNYLNTIDTGKNIGIISDAGCPGVADPGAAVIEIAHKKNIKVIPLIGPSSILLSLMASGFNGQSFSFHGYLPKEKFELDKKLRLLEKDSKTQNQTQIFIETPFRNDKILDNILATCNKNTLLCIATDITLDSEFIKTKNISDWKKNRPRINKRPTVFLLYCQ